MWEVKWCLVDQVTSTSLMQQGWEPFAVDDGKIFFRRRTASRDIV